MEQGQLGRDLSLWWTVPFAGMLLSIALMPILVPHFWHRHFRKISTAWALVLVLPFIGMHGDEAAHLVAETFLLDYVPFVLLLLTLFTISGGVFVRGTLQGTPWVNAAILLIGTAMASLVGTTGASVLMVRPLLRANQGRQHKVHTLVFFIFLVSNIGGCLTPLGDPPLFLGFLHHVPFFWTLETLWPHLLVMVGILIPIYVLCDSWLWYLRESPETRVPIESREPIRLEGKRNFVLLAGVIGAVLVSGAWKPRDLQLAEWLENGTISILGVRVPIENVTRDVLLLMLVAMSLVITPAAVRRDNGFSWFPIKEVAWLFAGIFATIIPALQILKAGEHGSLAELIRTARTPAHYFFATGLLSSFLDNAPTYLTFFTTAIGRLAPDLPEAEAVRLLIERHEQSLVAISLGAVFMGANTYIGNAPNFMVKSIAEEAGVRMPDFFSYIFRYVLPILGPTYVVIWWVFFRG